MPRFSVMCYDQGLWDQNKNTIIEAENELRAAMQVCGEPLVESGKMGQLRAQAWPVLDPNAKKRFYLPHNSVK